MLLDASTAARRCLTGRHESLSVGLVLLRCFPHGPLCLDSLAESLAGKRNDQDQIRAGQLHHVVLGPRGASESKPLAHPRLPEVGSLTWFDRLVASPIWQGRPTAAGATCRQTSPWRLAGMWTSQDGSYDVPPPARRPLRRRARAPPEAASNCLWRGSRRSGLTQARSRCLLHSQGALRRREVEEDVVRFVQLEYDGCEFHRRATSPIRPSSVS